MFLIWVPVLAFAIYRSEQQSTRIFLIGALLLNLTAAGWMFFAGDADRFAAFERVWRESEPSYHPD